MFSGLGRKSEENEEDKSANDARPPSKVQASYHEVVIPPEDGRDLPDTTEIVMGVFPTDPWRDGGRSRIDNHRKYCQGCGAHDLCAGQSHQTEISTCGEG